MSKSKKPKLRLVKNLQEILDTHDSSGEIPVSPEVKAKIGQFISRVVNITYDTPVHPDYDDDYDEDDDDDEDYEDEGEQ